MGRTQRKARGMDCVSRAALLLPATVFLSGGLGVLDARAATLRPEAVHSWDLYLEWADAKVEREISGTGRFLQKDYLAPAEKALVEQRLRRGEVVVRRVKGVIPTGKPFKPPDSAVHHWWGSILLPGIRLEQLMPFLKDYDHHAGRFPEVEQSRLLSHEGEAYRFFFRLRRTKALVTVYYNTEQECTYRSHGRGRVSSRSWATRIQEIDKAGTAAEKELPPGEDRGFLWRLVSWWRFEETEQGTVVECESASLSRGIPGFVVLIPGLRGYLDSVPRESIENILLSIRKHMKPSSSQP